MNGRIIGGYAFSSKAKDGKPSKDYVRLVIEQPMPEGGHGINVEVKICEPSRLPCTIKDMIGKYYAISTNNNFIADFYELPSPRK